jgi:hypothetical protein
MGWTVTAGTHGGLVDLENPALSVYQDDPVGRAVKNRIQVCLLAHAFINEDFAAPGAMSNADDLVKGQRLGEVIAGPETHGFRSRFNVRLTRYQNNLGISVKSPDLTQQIDSAAIAEINVCDYQVKQIIA